MPAARRACLPRGTLNRALCNLANPYETFARITLAGAWSPFIKAHESSSGGTSPHPSGASPIRRRGNRVALSLGPTRRVDARACVIDASETGNHRIAEVTICQVEKLCPGSKPCNILAV